MGQALGSKFQLQLDYESTFGADPAAPSGLLMPVVSFGLKGDVPKNESSIITGDRSPGKPFDGNEVVQGDVVVPVDATAFPYWLKSMFGSPTTAGTSPYTHTFKVGDSMPSMVLDTRYHDGSGVVSYAKYNGVKVSRCAISFGGDQEMTATLGLAGKKETLGSAPLDGSPTTIAHTPWFQRQAVITEGGSALGVGNALDINIDFGLDLDNYVIDGTGQLYSIPEGIVRVTGSLTALFTSNALITKAINGTETSIVVTLTNGSLVLELKLNEVQLQRSMPGMEGPKGIRQTLPFVAYVDDHSDDSVIVAELTNTVSSYA